MRRLRGRDVMAAIRPAGKPEGTWALPKGLIGAGEEAERAALREVAEETGVEATPVEKLGDVRYVYTWAGERVFKVVSFFLFRYRSGRLGDIRPEHAHEIAETRWLPWTRPRSSWRTRASGRWRPGRSSGSRVRLPRVDEQEHVGQDAQPGSAGPLDETRLRRGLRYGHRGGLYASLVVVIAVAVFLILLIARNTATSSSTTSSAARARA